jgi:hypothetical protein
VVKERKRIGDRLWENKKRKKPREPPGSLPCVGSISALADYDNVCCLQSFRTLRNLELYLIAFVKGLEAVPLNGGEVNEDIISVVSGNEPKTLLLIKPFYSTFGHYNSPPFFS